MSYVVLSTRPINIQADCFIVGVFKDKKLSKMAEKIDALTNGSISSVLAKGDLVEEMGESLILYNTTDISMPRILLVYCGEEGNIRATDFHKITQCIAYKIKGKNWNRVVDYLPNLDINGLGLYEKIRQSIELIEDSLNSFDEFKTKNIKKSDNSFPREFIFYVSKTDLSKGKEALKHAIAISSGIKLTKYLANLPANICTPPYFAKQAENLALEMGMEISVLEKQRIKEEKMGALMAVAQGSNVSPRFVILEYNGADKKQKPIVLVGKGVTFDSGGICLKIAAGMEEMKFDMAGAASVLGVLKAIALLKLPINVKGVIPLTENLINGSAVKPGDVVKSLSGQTIEVINTDAEGRLILADALTYSERFNPAAVIDIATLTGAIIVSLGSVASGLMSNDNVLAEELEKAGKESNDKLWILPLWDDYQEQIDSNVADIANIGVGGAKSITAACFLSRFTKNFRWAHLDIAGTAWKSGKNKAATGRPVSLLVQFLLNRCQAVVNE